MVLGEVSRGYWIVTNDELFEAFSATGLCVERCRDWVGLDRFLRARSDGRGVVVESLAAEADGRIEVSGRAELQEVLEALVWAVQQEVDGLDEKPINTIKTIIGR